MCVLTEGGPQTTGTEVVVSPHLQHRERALVLSVEGSRGAGWTGVRMGEGEQRYVPMISDGWGQGRRKRQGSEAL